MTIYYSLTFMLLAAEMVTFCLLVAPLPYAIKKRLFTFLTESKVVAKVAYGLKISFIFVAILFADALQRMFRVTAESDLAKSNKGMVTDLRTDTSIAARKFYAQRNVYLTGFCLFLSLVLTRTFYIILDLIHTQEEYAKLKKAGTSGAGGAKSEDQTKEIASLKKQIAELKQQERDFDILKKQAAQNSAEYDRLATELNTLTGSNKSNKRVD
ncbi:B-cell receptor-associated 31-like protein [Pholiota conissans]|uniref:Endoplasmic reticulum transmembrane protein n=1 Tax=Pholiota conissans TaxID=109636 RepID=A0A9P5Z8Z8_9AGAR|nr:B-cell receptor-associated 31-like protein [Pholiota conissans]